MDRELRSERAPAYWLTHDSPSPVGEGDGNQFEKCEMWRGGSKLANITGAYEHTERASHSNNMMIAPELFGV